MAQSKRKQNIAILRRISIVTILAILSFVFWVYLQLMPPSGESGRVKVVIPPRSGVSKAAGILADKGVVRNALVFAIYTRLSGRSAQIKSGDYSLPRNLSPSEVLRVLRTGGADPNIRRVTFPEGLTVTQMGSLLQKKSVIKSSADFVTLAKSPVGLSVPFELSVNGLEGYLFPDTYNFKIKDSPARVEQTMLDEFARVFYVKHHDEINKSKHTLNEIVTIASMIEREAEVANDRPLIAGVIENRLKKGMKLDIDATVLYAIGHHKTRVLYSDLKVDSPYNTYRHKGLPPGPICSPGLPSLVAALHPAVHKYLFYVA